MTLGVGDELDGRFRLEACIGSGGYGDVFRATQLSLGRTVAVKLVHARLADRQDIVRRFEREARLTSRLDHPNAVRVVDFGDSNGTLYIAMEFIDGITLKRAMADGPLSPDRVRSIVAQVADALQAAHEMDLMHRDLKPSNVLLNTQGREERAVVIDFGLVKAFYDDEESTLVTQTDVMIGTPSYMSPETVQGGAQDGRSDLFSLGVLMFEMLSGERPFGGNTPLESAVARITQDAPPLDETVPEDLRQLVAALLARQPRDRPPSARWVAQVLRGERAFDAVPPTPPTLPATTTASVQTEGVPRAAETPRHSLDAPTRAQVREPDILTGSDTWETDSTPSDSAPTPRFDTATDTAQLSPQPPTLTPAAPSVGPALRTTQFQWPLFALALAALAGIVALVLMTAPSHAPSAIEAAPVTTAPVTPPSPSGPVEAPVAAVHLPPPDAARTLDLGTSVVDSADTTVLDTAATSIAPEQIEAAMFEAATVVAHGTTTAPRGIPSAASSSRRRGGEGTLSVNIDPYGQVYVNGDLLGDAPVVRTEVRAGTVTVETRYGDQRREERVRIADGAHRSVTHRFRR